MVQIALSGVHYDVWAAKPGAERELLSLPRGHAIDADEMVGLFRDAAEKQHREMAA